jgi:hypothetical protein
MAIRRKEASSNQYNISTKHLKTLDIQTYLLENIGMTYHSTILYRLEPSYSRTLDTTNVDR